MGVLLCANISGREVPERCVHANVAVGEVLEPGVCGIVAVGGALEPCRSTTVGAARTLLMSPCFRKGAENHHCHGRTRGAIITCYRDEPGWDAGLVPP
jgi:hypothetical protein